MNEHKDQRLDKLSKKVVKSSTLETPSMNFTANVMSQIESLSTENTLVHKPLISKLGWFIILVIVLGIVGYTTYGNVESITWFETIDYSVIYNNKIMDLISGIVISKTLMYAIAFFGLAWFIQIPLMKHHFNKQLKY